MSHPTFARLLRDCRPVVLVLAVFLLAELCLYCYHSTPLASGETDGIGYMQRAQGPLFQMQPFHGPGYPLAIRLVHLAGPDLFSSAKLASLAFGLLFLTVAWLLLSSVTTSGNALIASALMSVNWVLTFRSVVILSDVMAASLMLTGLAVILAPQDAGRRHFISSGVLCGLAYLTRYINAVALSVPLVWLLLSPRGKGRIGRAAPFYAGFALATLPWLAFSCRETGNPFWNSNHLNVAFAIFRNGQGWNAFPSEDQFPGLADVIRADPYLFFRNWLHNLLRLPSRTLDLFPTVGVLGGVGFFFWLCDLNWRKLTLLTIMLFFGLATCLVWIEERFLLPLLPLAASFIASGILVLPRRIRLPAAGVLSRASSLAIPLRTSVAILSIAATVALSASYVESFFSGQAPEYMSAAEWISSHPGGSDTSVMALKPHIAFFSNSRPVYFRDCRLQYAAAADLPAIIDQARPTYLVYDERLAAIEFPQFSKLLSPESDPYPGVLEPVLEIRDPKKLVIYRCLRLSTH